MESDIETYYQRIDKLFLAELHQDLRKLQTDVKQKQMRGGVSGGEIVLRLEQVMEKIRQRSERDSRDEEFKVDEVAERLRGLDEQGQAD